jgi:hypothetical protein
MGSGTYGQFTINSGDTLSCWLAFNGDPGPVFVECREFTESTRGNNLMVTQYGCVRNTDNTMTYLWDITNNGPQVAVFEFLYGTF